MVIYASAQCVDHTVKGFTVNDNASCDDEVKTLYLWNNQLTTLPPEIGQLTNLTSLYLDANPITDADLGSDCSEYPRELKFAARYAWVENALARTVRRPCAMPLLLRPIVL